MNRVAASRSGAGSNAPVYLKLLGDVRFTRPPDIDATPRSKRARALVAYLALVRDHTAQRTRLADLFWGDRGEAQARGSLRQCLLEARGAAGEPGEAFLASDRETVSLGGEWASDVADIDRMLESPDVGVIANAIELAGHETLLGSLYVSKEFDEWLTLARAEFDRKLADAARRGLARATESGDGEAARRIADEYLLRDPGDEEVTVLAIHADAARGAAPVAHRRFQKLRDHLAAEYGTVPDKATYDALAAVAARGDRQAIASAPPIGGASGPPVLIVGPFEEVGIAAELGHLAGGVREEVVSGLSRFRDLRVLVEDAVPTSGDASLYDNASAAYVLTVTLRQAPGGVRVTPVLRRLADHSVVWSHQIALDKLDLQQVIDVIVDRIIGAVAPRLEGDSARSVKPGALYARYMLAKQFAFYPMSTHAQAKDTVAELEAIIAEDPELAVAYGPLIRMYNTHYGYTIAGEDPAELRDRAFGLAQTALALDRGHVHNYTVMGWCHLWRGNWDAARTHFQQALRLNPYHAERIKEAAFGLIFLGDFDDGDAYLQRCLELDPLPNDNFFEDLGFLRLLQRRPEEAASYLDLIAEPTLIAELFRVMAAAATGRANAPATARAWRGHVEAIWSAKSPMTDDNLVNWLKLFLPFRDPEHWRTFEDYLRAALR